MAHMSALLHNLLALLALLACPFCRSPVAALHVERAKGRAEEVRDDDGEKTGLMSFEHFVKKYGRTYQPGTEEFERRHKIFEEQAQLVTELNRKIGGQWRAAINRFADYTQEERWMMKGKHPMAEYLQEFIGGARAWSRASDERNATKSNLTGHTSNLTGQDDTQVNKWDNLHMVNVARDQSSCGSCWAFTAETTLRVHAEIYGTEEKFAVGQIVSCMDNPHHCGGDGGCQGATASLALDYALTYGLKSESEFPAYPVGGGEVTCPPDVKGKLASAIETKLLEDGSEVHMLRAGKEGQRLGQNTFLYGWKHLPTNKVEPVMRALAEVGPVTVSIAPGDAWFMYQAGIMPTRDTANACDADNVLSHGNMLFGYGSENGIKYWHLKNSWGPEWGENGNLRLERSDDEDNLCAWDHDPHAGSGCDDGPRQVWVCGTCGLLYNSAVPYLQPTEL